MNLFNIPTTQENGFVYRGEEKTFVPLLCSTEQTTEIFVFFSIDKSVHAKPRHYTQGLIKTVCYSWMVVRTFCQVTNTAIWQWTLKI